jgi:hypothetical protein
MALEIPQDLNINPFDCRWDPIDPHSCFDDTSCGCYVSPCDYFGIETPDCELDTSDLCCIEVKTC